jgi:hypothetical protein
MNRFLKLFNNRNKYSCQSNSDDMKINTGKSKIKSNLKIEIDIIESQIYKICKMRIPFLVSRCIDFNIKSVEVFKLSDDEVDRLIIFINDLDTCENNRKEIVGSYDLNIICYMLNNTYDYNFYIKDISVNCSDYVVLHKAIFVQI